jgi:menaquinone-dependent protoporphyrinogen oxidase
MRKSVRKEDKKMTMSEHNYLTRRQFLKFSGVAAGAMALGCAVPGPGSISADTAKVTFPEHSCGEEKAMTDRILVAYASRCGSTGEVAKAIGRVLCDKGASVDVRLVNNVKDVAPYRAVIVGSAIRMSKWLSEATEFVETNRAALSQVPVAYFLNCYTMREPTEDNRRKTLAYLDPVLTAAPEIHPVDIGLFAGVVDYNKLSWLLRKMLKKKGLVEGDFRDWNLIRAWAAGLRPALLREQAA